MQIPIVADTTKVRLHCNSKQHRVWSNAAVLVKAVSIYITSRATTAIAEKQHMSLYCCQCNTQALLPVQYASTTLPHTTLPTPMPLLQAVAARYGVLLEKAGIALRGLFIINPEGIIQQVTINDLVS
jgi:hypothetical protein